MNNSISETKSCCCSTESPTNVDQVESSKIKPGLKGILSILLSIGIAFFSEMPCLLGSLYEHVWEYWIGSIALYGVVIACFIHILGGTLILAVQKS